MKMILLILLSIVGLGAALFVLYVVYAFCRIVYRYYTNAEYRKDFDAKAASKREQLAIQKAEARRLRRLSKRGSGLHWLSYPSPLNSWGLWN